MTNATASPLTAGVARREITPPVGVDLTGFAARMGPSESVLDALWAKALVLESDDGARAAVVSLDVLGLSHESVVHLRGAIEQATGIPGDHVLFAASHTHSGPATQVLNGCGEIEPSYIPTLHEAIVEAVTAAAGELVPVATACGRRANDRLDALSKNRRVAGGPSDGTLSLVQLRRVADDTLLSVLFSYTCHPVVLGGDSRRISADWVGAAARSIEAQHPGCVALFANGPTANINPSERGTVEIMQAIGDCVGEEALTLIEEAELNTAPRLRISRTPVDLPMLPLPPTETLERLKADYLTDAEAKEALDTDGGRLAAKSARVFAGWADNALQGGLGGRAPAPTPAEVQVLQIGDAKLVALPGEMFVEFGLVLRREFGDHVLPLAYTNVNVGYVPWPDAYAQGGYEVDIAYKYYGYPSNFAAEAGARLLDAARCALHALGD